MDRVEYEKNTIQDLLNFHKVGELELNPWYQRRAVWTNPQKSYLINTILEQKPVPTIYIRHAIDVENEKSIREVVDGQQRLRSIIGYRDNQFGARHPNYKKPIKYADLKVTERNAFLMTSMSVGYLIGAGESDVIEIFGRINSVAKSLNAQEKRNAEFSGEFKQFTVRMASNLLPFWRAMNIFSANDISRMAEVEFVADLSMNFVLGLQDYSPAKLKKYYKANDESFEAWDACEAIFEKTFGKINELDSEMVRDTIFSRPPILFSLCMVLKDNLDASTANVEDIMSKVDRMVQSDVPAADRPDADLKFIGAISSSTQRIASRKIRDDYLRSMF